MADNRFYLNDSHDIELDSTGNIRQASESADTVAQRVETYLKTHQGEHYLDRSIGVPWFPEVMRKNPDTNRIRALLISVISGIRGVSKILEFNVGFDGASRTFSVNFKLLADDGTTVTGGI